MCLTDLANPQYINGERTGIRTPDTRLRRALLYPAELCTHISFSKSGADEGSRTPTPKALDPKSSASANSATSAYFLLVEDGGFEPPKAQLTDLQSAPFGHSGNPPHI